MLLEDAKQLHLYLSRHFANLVEEYRPAVGEFEAAQPFLGRAGERALFMAEESASMRPLGSAAQLTFTSGRFLRSLFECTARAISPFPVPVSPRIRTEERCPRRALLFR